MCDLRLLPQLLEEEMVRSFVETFRADTATTIHKLVRMGLCRRGDVYGETNTHSCSYLRVKEDWRVRGGGRTRTRYHDGLRVVRGGREECD
jgi:hypothetical protein